MKKSIIVVLTLVSLSCSPNNPDFEKQAQLRVYEIMRAAKYDIIYADNFKTPQFKKMDSLERAKIWDEIIHKTAKQIFITDGAYYLTKDCIVNPSKAKSAGIAIDTARKDSIYNLVFCKKIKQMKDSSNLDDFKYKDFLVHNERLKRLADELNSLCKK